MQALPIFLKHRELCALLGERVSLLHLLFLQRIKIVYCLKEIVLCC